MPEGPGWTEGVLAEVGVDERDKPRLDGDCLMVGGSGGRKN